MLSSRHNSIKIINNLNERPANVLVNMRCGTPLQPTLCAEVMRSFTVERHHFTASMDTQTPLS